MVRLLMAHAASFWVPKSPCREKACHCDVHTDNNTGRKIRRIKASAFRRSLQFKDCFVSPPAAQQMCLCMWIHKDTNLGQLLDDHWNQPSTDHSLNLLLVSCCDVGQEPDSFLQTKPATWSNRYFSQKRALSISPVLLFPCFGLKKKLFKTHNGIWSVVKRLWEANVFSSFQFFFNWQHMFKACVMSVTH